MAVKLVIDKRRMLFRQARMQRAQRAVDEECIKQMHPYTPVAKPWFVNHGKLRRSVRSPEPGVIDYTAPFSRHDYYANVNHKHGGNPRARRLWFEYVKSKHGSEINRAAARALGTRYRR